MLEERTICSENELDEFFLSYDKILLRLSIQKIKTRTGKIITYKDLRKAITVMQRKHRKCRWKSEKIRSRKFYILVEGYYWLIYVYFNNDKKLIDADIDFFTERIQQYEEILNLNPKKLFQRDMKIEELVNFFNKKYETVEKAILKMIKFHSNYRYIENNNYIISKEGVEWICKNCFKEKYLGILEDYKMYLTEEYIKAGYIYDNFFNKN